MHNFKPGPVARGLVPIGGVPAFPRDPPAGPSPVVHGTEARQLARPTGDPTAETTVEQLSIVEEQETIQRYAELVAARVAHDRNPLALGVGVNELRSFLSLLGWRAAMRLSPNQVGSIEQPTTFIQGDEDFLGAPEDVRGPVESMPDVRLETLAAGHIP